MEIENLKFKKDSLVARGQDDYSNFKYMELFILTLVFLVQLYIKYSRIVFSTFPFANFNMQRNIQIPTAIHSQQFKIRNKNRQDSFAKLIKLPRNLRNFYNLKGLYYIQYRGDPKALQDLFQKICMPAASLVVDHVTIIHPALQHYANS